MKWISEKRLPKVTALILVVTWVLHRFFTPTSSTNTGTRRGDGPLLIVSTTLVSLIVIWAFRPNNQDVLLTKESDRDDGDHCDESSIEDLSDEEPTMTHGVVEGKNDDNASSPPPILTPEQIKEIHNRALPLTTRLMTWRRIYSLAQDGDSFIHMMNQCKPYQHALIVFRTSNNGHILGGYTDTSWDTVRDTRAMFFGGGGKAFVFATHPDMSCEEQIKYQNQFWRTNRNDSLYIFKCSGRNDYVQICDWKKGTLGMGGGGGGGSNSTFGWYVQDNFTVGSTGYCDTFCNPPLHDVGQKDGRFEIVDMDIYGFESMAMSFQNSGS